MSFITVLLFIAGIILLVWGADLLVRGAARLAAAAGVSPLVIGLTVVAFGTSAPELAISVRAALLGQSDLTLGNIIGSNIANILLILGLAAVVAPLLVAPQLLRREVPAMIGISLLLWLLAADGSLTRGDGALLVALLGAFLAATLWANRSARPAGGPITPTGSAPDRSMSTLAWNLALVIGGLILLVAGAQWLVDGAVAAARALGVGEVIIGLTVVAVGTSLPEIATSMLASIRGEREIAVGNVVGSNILNILGVMGLTTLLTPEPIAVGPGLRTFDLTVMVASAIACLPIFLNGRMIARWDGGLFLGYYLAYTTYLILAATRHEALPAFTVAMLWFALPLTAVTIVVSLLRNERRRRASRSESNLRP